MRHIEEYRFGCSRRAAVNKGLLVVLGLVVVGCGVYWMFGRSEESVVGPAMATIYCKQCGPQQMPPKDVAKLDFDGSGKLKCPKCGKFSASFSESGTVNEAITKP